MTEHEARFDKRSVVAFALLFAIGLLGLTGRIITAQHEGYSRGEILSFLGVVVVCVVLFVLLLSRWFAWRARLQVQTQTAMSPNAFVVFALTDATLVSQVDAFAVQLTGKRSRVRVRSYVTLVADRSSIRISSGSRKPREAVSFPTSTLVHASIGSARSGMQIVPSLNLHLSNGEADTTLTVPLLRAGRLFPRFVRGDDLNAALVRLRTATATAT